MDSGALTAVALHVHTHTHTLSLLKIHPTIASSFPEVPEERCAAVWVQGFEEACLLKINGQEKVSRRT